VSPYTVEQRTSWFDEHVGGRHRLFVAEDPAGGILGYSASGRFRLKAGYDTTVEASIACRPEAVGKGLGSRLYRALFDGLAGQDVRRIVAGIAQPNDASNRLHEKMGFRRVGVFSQVGRKFGKYWDVLWLEREIDEGTI
jgi:phosphinothricin acetyltransferase